MSVVEILIRVSIILYYKSDKWLKWFTFPVPTICRTSRYNEWYNCFWTSWKGHNKIEKSLKLNCKRRKFRFQIIFFISFQTLQYICSRCFFHCLFTRNKCNWHRFRGFFKNLIQAGIMFCLVSSADARRTTPGKNWHCVFYNKLLGSEVGSHSIHLHSEQDIQNLSTAWLTICDT